MTDMITLRNEGKNHLIVEINGKEVIREFYASGESEVNHTYHWHDRPQPSGDAVKALDIVIEWQKGINTKAHQALDEDNRPKYEELADTQEKLRIIRAALTQPSICKDGLPKLTQENPYVTQPKADVDTLMKDVYAAYENDDDSHKKSTVAWVIDHLAAQGYIGEWRPIECAPKDGEYFLVCLPRMMNLIMRARFDTVHKQWLSERDNDGAISRVEFFHAGDFWMPMPKPPAAPKKEEKHE